MQNSVCLLLVAAAIMMIMMMAPAPYWPVSDPKNKIFFHQKKKTRGKCWYRRIIIHPLIDGFFVWICWFISRKIWWHCGLTSPCRPLVNDSEIIYSQNANGSRSVSSQLTWNVLKEPWVFFTISSITGFITSSTLMIMPGVTSIHKYHVAGRGTFWKHHHQNKNVWNK